MRKMIAFGKLRLYGAPMSQNNDADNGERIAKVLARAGVASRREVERMIAEGRIKLHGKTLNTPATLVKNTKHILVDGKPVGPREKIRVWRYHKVRETMTTHHDPGGRKTVFESLPHHLPRVISIGRLDYNTEGLLLLTNDGGVSRWIELPATAWKRTYRVRVHGRVNMRKLDSLKNGVRIDGIQYGNVEAKLEKTQGTNSWLEISIFEGKNREVRRIMEHLGLQVTRLIRTAYGPFELGTLDRGAIEEIPFKILKKNIPADILGLLSDHEKTNRGHAVAKKTSFKPTRSKTKPSQGRGK